MRCDFTHKLCISEALMENYTCLFTRFGGKETNKKRKKKNKTCSQVASDLRCPLVGGFSAGHHELAAGSGTLNPPRGAAEATWAWRGPEVTQTPAEKPRESPVKDWSSGVGVEGGGGAGRK